MAEQHWRWVGKCCGTCSLAVFLGDNPESWLKCSWVKPVSDLPYWFNQPPMWMRGSLNPAGGKKCGVWERDAALPEIGKEENP